MLPVAKASHSGTANPCSCKSLAAVNAAWTAGVPQWGVATGATGSLRAGRKVRTVVLGSHFLSLCAEPERLRCIAFI